MLSHSIGTLFYTPTRILGRGGYSIHWLKSALTCLNRDSFEMRQTLPFPCAYEATRGTNVFHCTTSLLPLQNRTPLFVIQSVFRKTGGTYEARVCTHGGEKVFQSQSMDTKILISFLSNGSKTVLSYQSGILYTRVPSAFIQWMNVNEMKAKIIKDKQPET